MKGNAIHLKAHTIAHQRGDIAASSEEPDGTTALYQEKVEEVVVVLC